MPASITLSNLSWSTPDNSPLFSDLTLSFGPERTGLVGRNGIGKTTLFRIIAGLLSPQSGNLVINGTFGILRQTVQVCATETVADLFGIRDALALLRRAEAGGATIEELEDADWTLEARVASALDRVDLVASLDTPLSTLSGGQRTRVGLAALLFAEPDFLLLDEPTNNLDRDGREAVLAFLSTWRVGAIVISHDRELLETMDAIVELTSLGAKRYGGNWSQYRARKARELAAAHRELDDAENRLSDIARRTQTIAERKARKDGVGRKTAAKGGMPRIILGRLQDRSESTSGRNARLAEDKRAEAMDAAASARKQIEILQPLSVDIAPTHLPANKTVLEIVSADARYDTDRPVLQDMTYAVVGPERIAITGPNGSGKSTFLAMVTGQLQPWRGAVNVTTDFAMLDQRVSLLDPSMSIRDNFLRLNPGTDENICRAVLARFRFRADAALQAVANLSGGQILRAGLACVLGAPQPPSLLILDEPTNHLDIDSIESVEAGLRAYDGALLVVSHDEAFLEGIRITRRLELSAL
ncbi:ATPase component of ABC transporters with duplicated ATPase domain [Candidatus Filomicrobium marinum]|uniref:ATPase component of ABC transporters with duplicated ATPase domain n=1 Tax=Candidatus Filomicrobium marinum TaxID=1608628 RepID=A0A0D6JDD1_9HYPH|nr:MULTISPECIES: ABC-F family ATP-binding cassette domain-containing protein [Filomicrobium]MCV0368121.1 ATP-binding cassette domain-containing protein [Filomicrobium sp.]CFX14429.1 ATPase component of ABC transporters with duplicated ATPase domain [Candidatus Filomicrobium marinum]CPR17792.1 ATPase component of ABC transporters with duplicated ATPase domain [Candidatus Filomicrobium marinum]